MKNQFSHTMLTICTKDANNGNSLLGYAVVPAENKYYWHIFYVICCHFFKDSNIMISDKASGLSQFFKQQKKKKEAANMRSINKSFPIPHMLYTTSFVYGISISAICHIAKLQKTENHAEIKY